MRFLLAPGRAAVAVLLGVIGLTAAVVSLQLTPLLVTFPAITIVVRRLAAAGRRLANATGVPVPVPYAPPPPAPRQRPDGWFEVGNQLYRSPRMPARLAWADAYGADPANGRDWLWLILTPFTGGLAAAAPLALIGGGARAAFAGGWWTVTGIVAVLAGFAGAPAMLRLYGRWNHLLLGPLSESWWHTSGAGPWASRTMRATWLGASLALLAIAAPGIALVHLVTLTASWGTLYPSVVTVTRPYVARYRRVAEVPSPYLPPPAEPEPDETGRFRVGRLLYGNIDAARRAQRHRAILRDPATWRDLLWTVTVLPVGLIGMVPALLFSVGVFGLLGQPLTWAFWAPAVGLASGAWVAPWWVWQGLGLAWPPVAAVPGWVTLLAGAVAGVLALTAAGPLLRLQTAFGRLLLTPTRASQLASRVRRLTETRADAIDGQAAELRRIERDLHDGAQARMVAVGLSLATVEALLDTDPARARALLAQARSVSEAALTELRALVRGINPPVLAERGLVDAVRAVALAAPVPVRVSADLSGRLDGPVESAAYFAIVEALTNAVRHAGATAIGVDIRHSGRVLRAEIRDDGRGGANPRAGTGLRGIERRLGTFDGILEIASPAGGPTVLTMEIPCALSSPRTSTSSGTA